LLGSRIAHWIGHRSYSMYLFHAFCLSVVEDHILRPSTTGRYLAGTAICYLLCLAVASMVYIVVEKPSISLGHRLSNRVSSNRSRRKFEGRLAMPRTT
jgi:peptidoglycan/LPS O-acetylase OafA/YrhL